MFLHCCAKNSPVWLEGQSSWTTGDTQASPFRGALQLPLVDVFPQVDWILFVCFIPTSSVAFEGPDGFFLLLYFSVYRFEKINKPLKPGIYFPIQWLWVNLCYSNQNMEWIIIFSLSFLLINNVGWKCKKCKNSTDYTNTHTCEHLHVQDRKKFRKFKHMPRSVFICDLDQLSKLHVLEKQEILKCSFGAAWWQWASELNQIAVFAGNWFKKKLIGHWIEKMIYFFFLYGSLPFPPF